MKREEIQRAVEEALDRIVDRVLHPENYIAGTDRRAKPGNYGWQIGRPLPAPRYRLTARLEMLCAVKTWEAELMRAILADQESIEDAKQHRNEESRR